MCFYWALPIPTGSSANHKEKRYVEWIKYKNAGFSYLTKNLKPERWNSGDRKDLCDCPVVIQLLSCVWLSATPWTIAPSFPVLHYLLEFAQTHVHWVSDAIQACHPLLPPSPPALNLSQHHGLFQCVSSSHQVAKVLELQLQHQSFQWIFRVDFL